MMWSLGLESTRVLALFMETIRDPQGFVAALGAARDHGVAVVALKVGASVRARAAVATHSGAIAGEDAVYEALFDAYGVHRVLTMDEMADTVELLAAERTIPHRGGLGAVHDSGGERALLIDTAHRVGVPLPELGGPAVAVLGGLLDPGLEAANPVDAWGTGRDSRDVFVGCLDALAQDPAIGVVAFSVDLTAEEGPDDTYAGAVLEVAERTEKPITVLTHLATTVDSEQASRIRAGGVPVLHGTETGLRAVAHLIARAERLAWPPQEPRLTNPDSVTENSPTSLLDRYGIPTATGFEVSDLAEVTEAATKIGFPVVLKTMASDHKSDIDGVVLGIEDETGLVRAYQEMAARLGPTATVSEQIAPGVEIGVGMVVDPQFGQVVLVSAGGTLIELLRDRVALLPPVDGFRAMRAIERLSVRPMLSGHRGSRPADIEALADLVVRFSELAVDVSETFSSIDLNPVIVGPDSAIAVDFLFEESP
jgi:acyl-CoA synthetase (NDP forming)